MLVIRTVILALGLVVLVEALTSSKEISKSSDVAFATSFFNDFSQGLSLNTQRKAK